VGRALGLAPLSALVEWTLAPMVRVRRAEPELGSVLNKDSIASGVVIQGFRIEGGFDEEATLLAERRGVEAR
jgi:hypothetical protein